jgi:uncharacterized protein (TIGR02246 family)
MRKAIRCTVTVGCFALTGCVAAAPKVDVAREEQAVRRLTADWFAAEVRRDLEASLSFLAPDAIIQPEGAPTTFGPEGMREIYKEFFAAPFTDLVMEERKIVVSESGDLAYDAGPWKMVLPSHAGPIRAPGKSLIVWQKRGTDWKVVSISFSMDTPPAPAAEAK